MKLDGYKIIQTILEARVNLKSAKAAREKIAAIASEYREETDPKRKGELAFRLKKARSDLALMPNREYDMYSEY